MEYFFGLAAECGSERQQAELFAAHFQSLSFESISGKTSTFDITAGQDQESNWWVDVMPSYISTSRYCASLEDTIDFSEAGFRMYTHLLSAPPFRFAMVGFQVSGFYSYSELAGILEKHDTKMPLPIIRLEGFVMSEEIWRKLGQPSQFSPFGNNHRWIRYRGERYSPLDGDDKYAKKLCALRDNLYDKRQRL